MSCELLSNTAPKDCSSDYQVYKLEMDDNHNLYKDGVLYAKILSMEKKRSELNAPIITTIEMVSDNPYLNGQIKTILMYQTIEK